MKHFLNPEIFTTKLAIISAQLKVFKNIIERELQPEYKLATRI